MGRRGYRAWGFRRVRIGAEEFAVVRVFLGEEGEVLAYQKWNRDLATRAEAELADLCRSSREPPLEEGDLLVLPELPEDLVLNGNNTERAVRFVRLFLYDSAFSDLVTKALRRWDDYREDPTADALGLFEAAVGQMMERLDAEEGYAAPGPRRRGRAGKRRGARPRAGRRDTRSGRR